MYTLYYSPGTASMVVHLVLLEIGAPHRLQLVDFSQDAQHGPYLLGADFSGADLLALMYMRWSRNMPRPVTAWPALRDYAGLMRSRPSWKRMYEIEGLTEWCA